MIALVTGQPGAGKTYYAVRKLAESLERGKVVATNVALVDDWPQKLANNNPFRWLIPGRRRRAAADYENRVIFSDDLDELFSIRLRGKGEGRGVMVLDEAHNWMNSRAWKDEDRSNIVRFFTQHRKLGWDVYLISQDANNIDRQVRSNYEYHIHLRNLRKLKLAGIPVVPMNLFMAFWMWNGVSSKQPVAKREAYRLTGIAKLYDTFATSHGLDQEHDDETGLWLPRIA